MNLDDLIGQFKKTLVDLGTKGVMTLLVAEAPFFGLPIIRSLTEAAIRYVIRRMINDTELAIYFVYTDQRTSLQAKRFENAAIERAKVESNPSASEEEKKRAEEELITAARILIKLGK